MLFRKIIFLLRFRSLYDIINAFGGVAHLGERLNGIQKVVGSIPIISTTKKDSPFCGLSFFCFITEIDFWATFS